MDSIIKLSSPGSPGVWEIPVVHEDEHLLALNKPSGLLTSPDPHNPERPSLIALLHVGVAAQKPWALQRGLSYLMNAQPLDEPASGVLLFAKSKPILEKLLNIFSGQGSTREYRVLVHAGPPAEEGEIDAKLSPDRSRPGYTRVDSSGGKRSRTTYKVLERFARYTLLQCVPHPDRKHQVRVHMRHAGFPVVGDAMYRGFPLLLSRLKPHYELKPGRQERPLINRAAVHSENLVFPHPVSGELMRITVPLPKDLVVGLKYLRRFGAVGGMDSADEPTATQ